MRIALVAPQVTAIREPQLGGSQAFVSDLARGLAGRGHEVAVYAATGSVIPGIRVVDTGVDPESLRDSLFRVSAGTSASASVHDAFMRVYSMVEAGDHDVVHNHAFDAAAISVAAALTAAVVHTLHLPPDALIAEALRVAMNTTNAPTPAVVSRPQLLAWRELIAVDTVLPSNVPTARIPWSVAPGSGAVFGGRLSPEKGAAEAIEICIAASVQIDMYGDAYDAEYVAARIEPHRSTTGVRLHGAVARAELWRAMARAAVVVCPALWDEPFGMVAAEAQACGTPVVGYRRGGLAEVVIDGATGFLVDPGDIPAASAAMGELGGISRRACRDQAVGVLDIETSLDAHEDLYRRVSTTERVPASV